MLHSDKLAGTSVIRDLALSPDCYDSLLYFFRAVSCLGKMDEKYFNILSRKQFFRSIVIEGYREDVPETMILIYL